MQPEEADAEPDEFGDGNGGMNPTLLWEYNGVHIDIDKDGTLTLIRKGPTKNDGTLVNDNDDQAGATIILDKDGNITAQTGDGKNSIVIDGKDGKITATADQEMDLVSTNGTIKLTSSGAFEIESSTDAVKVTGKQGITLTDGIGTFKMAEGQFQFKGVADEFLALMGTFVQTMMSATVLDPVSGPVPFGPSVIIQLTELLVKLQLLTGS